ncbi:hypothetical protein FRX31_030497 [Thalictrum thalictroides]|uniref:Uncharacterized protein n=1 Tax=Thalictrum thalictroides TaxID=46969 RepID=A0A7J6V4C5_THATH|nr:hypothetical protein FRX31_030497 [Thalictrum thalictroides]
MEMWKCTDSSMNAVWAGIGLQTALSLRCGLYLLTDGIIIAVWALSVDKQHYHSGVGFIQTAVWAGIGLHTTLSLVTSEYEHRAYYRVCVL